MDDAASGGTFDGEFDQYEYGQHTENIHFARGPVGIYKFYVRSFLLYDGLEDPWTVGVFVDVVEELLVRGIGNSQENVFNFVPYQQTTL